MKTISAETSYQPESYETTIRKATRHDIPTLSHALAHAFKDDPGHRWLFPSESAWAKNSHRRFAGLLNQTLNHGGIVTTTETLQGAAIWSPWYEKESPAATLKSIAHILRLTKLRTPIILMGGLKIETCRPQKPHWYLPVLGVAPEHQRKGLGKSLLEPFLKYADINGTTTWLVASAKKNIPFYQRLNYQVTGTLTLPKGPVMWPMVRNPHGKREGSDTFTDK